MASTKPLVSVIIPIYNTAIKYINKCLDSLTNQTYTNCEFIIVDDGSKLEIADYLDSLTKDSRIKIIHRPNGGICFARNSGISQMTGKYFMFFDADDYCSNNLIEKLVGAAETNKSDLCIADFRLISDTTDKEIGNMLNKFDCTVDMDSNNRKAILQQTFHYISSSISLVSEPFECSTKDFWLQGKVWGKLYSSDCFGSLFFPENGITVSQDTVYTIDVLKNCKKISFVKDACYFYYINQGSVSRHKKTMDIHYQQFITTKEKLIDYPDIFEGMYSLLFFGATKDVMANNKFWQGYKLIKSFCLLPEILEINKSLSLNGIAHSQEKRTRICLRNNWFLLLSIIASLSIVKEKNK